MRYYWPNWEIGRMKPPSTGSAGECEQIEHHQELTFQWSCRDGVFIKFPLAVFEMLTVRDWRGGLFIDE